MRKDKIIRTMKMASRRIRSI